MDGSQIENDGSLIHIHFYFNFDAAALASHKNTAANGVLRDER